MPDESTRWWWVVPVPVAILLFLAWGVWYWGTHPSLTAPDCAFGNAVCSVAAATWVLAAFALMSFVAATYAVLWTKRLFYVEVRPRLGQAACKKRGTEHPADIDIFVLADGTIIIDGRPVGVDRMTILKDYNARNISFDNLGRTALTDVRVKMYLGNNDLPYEVPLGNILCDRERHVTIYIAKSHGELLVRWDGATQEQRPIPFFAKDRMERAESFFEYGTDEPELPL